MKKNIMWFVLGACLFSSTGFAEDKTLGFDMGLGFNSKKLEYSVADVKFKPRFNTLAINATTFYSRASITAEHEVMLTSDPIYGADAFGAANTVDFKREDSALTLGYNAWRGLTVFGGYKQGSTTTYALYPADSQVFTNTASGPFIGVNYGFRIGDGVLGVSFAYADLRGETSLLFLGSSVGTDVPGKTRGSSYGISWSAPLTPELQFRLSLKTNRYKFTVNDPAQDVTGISSPAVILNTDEDYTILGISFSKQF